MVDDLADVLALLPLGLSVEPGLDRGADLFIITPDRRRLGVEVRSLRSPTPADVARLESFEPSGSSLAVLVADRIVPRVRELLSTAGWGWLDQRGHLRIVADGLLVDTDVASRLAVAGRSRPTLDTGVGLDVASAILAQPAERLSVRRLVVYTGRSLGAVHQAIRGLTEEGLLGADGLPLTPELFWEAAARWRPHRIPLGAVPEGSGDRRGRQLGLGQDPDEREQGSGWALCDTLAASAYGATVAVRGDHPPDFYLPDQRSVRVARQLLGEPTTPDRRAATVAIPPVGWACRHRVDLASITTRRRRTSWLAAHPVIVALDLSTDAGRGREILDDWTPPEPFVRVW